MQELLGTKIDGKIYNVLKKYVTKINNSGLYAVTAEGFAGIKPADLLNDYMREIDRFAKINNDKIETIEAKYTEFAKSYIIKVEDALMSMLIDKIVAK